MIPEHHNNAVPINTRVIHSIELTLFCILHFKVLVLKVVCLFDYLAVFDSQFQLVLVKFSGITALTLNEDPQQALLNLVCSASVSLMVITLTAPGDHWDQLDEKTSIN